MALSSLVFRFIWDFVPSKNTVYITFHICSSFTTAIFVSFPQGHGHSVGFPRSLGKGRGCGMYLGLCRGLPREDCPVQNVTGWHAPRILRPAVTLPRCLLSCPLPSLVLSIPPSLSLYSLCAFPYQLLPCLFYIAASHLLAQKVKS